LFTVYVLDMNVTLLQPHVKQSGAYVFKQPIVPPGLVIHFYRCSRQHLTVYRPRYRLERVRAPDIFVTVPTSNT